MLDIFLQNKAAPSWPQNFNNGLKASYLSSHVWYYLYTHCYMYHTLYFVNSVCVMIIYKHHGFFLGFLATFICFCVTVLFYRYLLYFVVKVKKWIRQQPYCRDDDKHKISVANTPREFLFHGMYAIVFTSFICCLHERLKLKVKKLEYVLVIISQLLS